MVVTAKRIYIFEFKLDGSPEEALAQIRERQYFAKYQDCGKKIVLVGANFSTQVRNVESHNYESCGKGLIRTSNLAYFPVNVTINSYDCTIKAQY